MYKVFMSHSSQNNAEAVLLKNWLDENGWNGTIFLDLDPKQGLVAGNRWLNSLNRHADQCEVVLVLISRAWLASEWCRYEMNLAARLNKRILPVLLEEIDFTDLPPEVTTEWHIIRLKAGRDQMILAGTLPITHESIEISYSKEGLNRLSIALEAAGVDPRHFRWPPEDDPERPPFRGLKPLEAEDAGIFFGREAAIVQAVDTLRGMREAEAPTLVILAASGTGKSSFLRAGLLPRLERDRAHFLPLPIVRPGRAAIEGETGLIAALHGLAEQFRKPIDREGVRAIVEGGVDAISSFLDEVVQIALAVGDDEGHGAAKPVPIFSIDQAEELFPLGESGESARFAALLTGLLSSPRGRTLAIFTIRSDTFEKMQIAPAFSGFQPKIFSLQPIIRSVYGDLIRGPVRRMTEAGRKLEFGDDAIAAILEDIDEGDARDALPLLAFILERLYVRFGKGGKIRLAEYQDSGRTRGAIDAAIERAMAVADNDPNIPTSKNERLTLLRRGFIPWLAGIDPETGAFRRRVALEMEIPPESLPLVELLKEQRLLVGDVGKNGPTIEPAHEVLLRQWSDLASWLKADTALLVQLDGIRRAAKDWGDRNEDREWLTHSGDRLRAAVRIAERPDLARSLSRMDKDYLVACRQVQSATSRRRSLTLMALVLFLVVTLGSVMVLWKRQELAEIAHWYLEMKPHVVSGAVEMAAADEIGKIFVDCEVGCPAMVTVPAGAFSMGSPNGIGERREHPAHPVTISTAFAVGRFEVTFEEWDHCVTARSCPADVNTMGWGRGRQPVINVSWDDAHLYTAWLSRMTGRRYRLLTEAEWEYVARAGASTNYHFGNDDALLGKYAIFASPRPEEVGSRLPNPWGLYDVHGNVAEWVEDCSSDGYTGAPTNGSAHMKSGCGRHIMRGGSWLYGAKVLRAAQRDETERDKRSDTVGFRVAREFFKPAEQASARAVSDRTESEGIPKSAENRFKLVAAEVGRGLWPQRDER